MIDRKDSDAGWERLACPKVGKGAKLLGNSESQQFNSVLGSGSEASYAAFPGAARHGARSGLWVAKLEAGWRKGGPDAEYVCRRLRDPLSLDFRPRAGSELVGKGTGQAFRALSEGSKYWSSMNTDDPRDKDYT